MRSLIQRHTCISFLVIAFGWTWTFAAIIEWSIVFPLLALFGPCLAAIVVLYATHGREGLAELLNKFGFQRSLLPWCVVAALLPLVLLIPQWFLYGWWFEPFGFEMHPITILSAVVALFIVGEEVGWRGYLLPYFLERYSPLLSSLLVGVVWAVWHLPNFLIPNYPHYVVPFIAFAIVTIAFSVLFTWLYLNTKGSLIIAVVFHAALNLFSLSGLEPSTQYWTKAAVYMLAALVVTGLLILRRTRSSKG